MILAENEQQSHTFSLGESERDPWMGTLYAVSSLLASDEQEQALLRSILQCLERETAMSRGVISLLAPTSDELIVEIAEGLQADQASEYRYQRGEGITGEVLASGEAAVIPQIHQEPRFRHRVFQRDAELDAETGFICVPILNDNEVIGTLAMDVPGAAAEDSEIDLQAAKRFLSIVASMIANDVRARRVWKLEKESLSAENLRLRGELKERFRPENIVGNSRLMRDLYARIEQVSRSDTTVLIRGESGAGKELVAAAVHYNSYRSSMPFIRVNCAALSESLLESELFGHVKGAFTGAMFERVGRIEEAEGGTLFLDEIGEFSAAIQVKLLRVLQEREYERVGSNETRHGDVRIICATNRDLEKAMTEGVFRKDLYYRINVFPIILPPLRDRKDDILLLANHFVTKYGEQMGKKITRISTPAINMMFAYHWPGNVRELENCIEHAVLLSDDGAIHGHHLPPTLQTPDDGASRKVSTLKARVQLLERDLIVDALKANEGNVTRASEELGITSRMLRYKMKNLEVDHKIFTR